MFFAVSSFDAKTWLLHYHYCRWLTLLNVITLALCYNQFLYCSKFLYLRESMATEAIQKELARCRCWRVPLYSAKTGTWIYLAFTLTITKVNEKVYIYCQVKYQVVHIMFCDFRLFRLTALSKNVIW